MSYLHVFVFYSMLSLGFIIYGTEIVQKQHRLFEIDFTNNRFLKDGEPFRYVSGSLHYFRVPRPYWRDRLRKYRAAGLNAVCTYVEWSQHEPQPGVYDFSGQQDLVHFIQLAQEEGLLVILRPGPYICAERDFGGYPIWLLYKNPQIELRTSDPSHTYYVLSWLKVLMPMIQPLLYGNGGPVIMVQVENEYGSYTVCDRRYTLWLRDVFRSYVGDKAVLFTTDGAGSEYLKCGPIPGVFTTVDFGPTKNVSKAFEPLRQVQPYGPLVNSEFYPGWLTHWGDPGWSTVATKEIVDSTRQLLKMNASFNFYVFHGGTNFAFTSGANNPPFEPQITSYDYDAPITEAGVLTEKYYAIKSVISEYMPVPPVPIIIRFPTDYGPAQLEPKIGLFDSSSGLDYGTFQYPQTFESLQQYSGFMLYQTVLPSWYQGRGYLVANNVHDRAIVFVNKKVAGIFSRADNLFTLFVNGRAGQPLWLLVENQGHINFNNMSDVKGLVENVTLNGETLTMWKQTGYPMNNVGYIPLLPNRDNVTLPAFYAGSFQIPPRETPLQDTFVNMTGWGKGFLYVNGINMGRYWPEKGPQTSLYLPGPVLLMGDNTVLVMELERERPDKTIRLVARPVGGDQRPYTFVEELNEDGSLKGITAM